MQSKYGSHIGQKDKIDLNISINEKLRKGLHTWDLIGPNMDENGFIMILKYF